MTLNNPESLTNQVNNPNNRDYTNQQYEKKL